MTTVTMKGLTFVLIIVHFMCIEAQYSYSRKTMYVPEKERTERIPNLSPAQCLEQCRIHRFCKAVGMDVEDHEKEQITTCFLLSRKPTKNDKEKEGSSMNLSVLYEDEEYSYTISYYITTDETNDPVHGSWGKWGQFTHCNTTCGMGYQLRERKCDNPMPRNDGFDCSGTSQEYKKCEQKECQDKALPPAVSRSAPDKPQSPAVSTSGPAKPTAVSTSAPDDCVDFNIAYPGKDLKSFSAIKDWVHCAKLCYNDKRGCMFWTYSSSGNCYLKSAMSSKKDKPGSVSGARECGEHGD